MDHGNGTKMPYILIIFQEHMEVAILTENRVRREPLQKNLMGGYSLLKDREILTGRETHKALSWDHLTNNQYWSQLSPLFCLYHLRKTLKLDQNILVQPFM